MMMRSTKQNDDNKFLDKLIIFSDIINMNSIDNSELLNALV